MFLKIFLLFPVCAVFAAESAPTNNNNIPPYVKQCQEDDPKLIQCFISALHHLRPYLAAGIKEIELPPVEPFKMEELSLSLTSGPNGYKISLKDIDVFGASNFTAMKLKLSENGRPFESKIHIPLLKINSRYQSSGVLLIIPASGNGTLSGQLEGINAIVKGKASVYEKNNEKYLHIDALTVDLLVKNVRLAVRNIYKNNRILTEAINLFLRENALEVFKVMLPQLKKKLSTLFMTIANQLLRNLPLHSYYVPKAV